jgi:hypothetical protein
MRILLPEKNLRSAIDARNLRILVDKLAVWA